MTSTTNPPLLFKLDPGIEFRCRSAGGRDFYVAHHKATGKFFHLGAEEYYAAGLLDGTRSLPQVVEQLHAAGINWQEQDLAAFVGQIVASRLASAVGAPAPSPTATEVNWWSRIPRILSFMVSQRIPIMNGHRLASYLEPQLGKAFSKAGFFVWLFLVLTAAMIVSSHREGFADELRRWFDPAIWMVLFAMWLVAKIIHEMGHAVAARRHGIQIGKIGVMFFFLAPLAFVDVTDAWKLQSRWKRMQIALGGVYLELAIAAVAVWLWWILPDGYLRHLSAQLFLVAGPTTLLVNANPLLRLDGYYVLSDLTEIPNLRMHGRAQLTAIAERILLGKRRPASMLDGWRRPFATLHAAASVVFQVVWMSGLIIGVAFWARGLGFVLALAATLLWAVLPLARWSIKVWRSEPAATGWLSRRRVNLLAWASLLVMVAHYLGTAESPLARRVPVVVQFRDQQIARASADAFVQNVHVVRGQRVVRGTLLAELDDPDLKLRRDLKADELELAELRSIQRRRQGELAQAAAEKENAESLQRQLAELDQQLAGLRVVAARDGLIVAGQLENLQGRFVKRGEELLRVCDPQEKELFVSVGESDAQAYQAAVAEQRSTSVRLRGGVRFATVPAKLRPRALRTLPHPALAATVGGPIAVEADPDSDEDMRAVEPQLQSLTPLDPVTSVEVRAGQIGSMTIRDDRSLVSRMIDSIWR